MRSRWFHPPLLHTAQHPTKKVSWLELFYDLIFVAAIIQLGDFLAHDVSLGGFIAFAGHFAPLWVAWSGFTFYANRYDVDDIGHRVTVLLQMFAVGTMAITSHDAMEGRPAAFTLAFAGAQGLTALLYLRAWLQEPTSRDYARYWGLAFALSAVAFALSAALPLPYAYGLWAIGVGVVLAAPFSAQSRTLQQAYPLDQEHLSERYGLLTIIVLGESFVKVLTALTATEAGVSPEVLLQGFFNLTLTCCLWWIYFDDIAGAEVREGRGSWIAWLLGHLPLALAFTAVGVGVKKALSFELGVVAPEGYRWLLAGAIALGLLSVALIDSVTERHNNQLSDRNRVLVRAASAFAILLMAQVGERMPAEIFLGLISAVLVAQVLFDIMMAPFEQTAITAQAVPTHQLALERIARPGGTPTRPNAIAQAVRLGAPAELRRDLYFFFIEGSWARVMLSFAFVYLFLNVVFGGLYALDPGAISGDTDHSFGDAFFFSVQTLSSLGYGAITPATTWADVLVTIEAAVGMLFAAIATGLVFAKASRPQASVMFSEVMVRTVRDGRPTLMLRIANARGNEVVDANVDITVIMDEVSTEGHHLRRLIDLPLVRRRSPIFTMSWTVMHVIDADSPLHGDDWGHIYAIIVTLMGHDGTYGQTTYARHLYRSDDIRRGHRFVDVVGELPDGRLLLDLHRFHDTQPESVS